MLGTMFTDLIGSSEWAGVLCLLVFTIFGAFAGMDMGLIILIDLPLLIFLSAIGLFPLWVALIILIVLGLILASRWNEGTI